MEIPDWKDMPKGIPLGTLSWEDVYIKARKELERNPTREETIEIFEEMGGSMKNAVQDDMPSQLDAMITEIVTECLKSKTYNTDAMTEEQLTSKKYCHQCNEIQETYWELSHCDKNPQGMDTSPEEHGNGGNCEDGYCNPESTQIEDESITTQYVREHAVSERCAQCHQYFESAGPQTDFHQMSCPNCNGAGIFESCVVCGDIKCTYCVVESDRGTLLPGTNCMMCGGHGRIRNTKTIQVGDEFVDLDIRYDDDSWVTSKLKDEISEAFLNQNIADWVADGYKINHQYSLRVDKPITRSKNDEDYVLVSIVSENQDRGCMHLYGWKETQ